MTRGLTQSMNVYTEGAGGAFTVLATSGVACQLFNIPRPPQPTGDYRVELDARRNLHYALTANGSTFTMPDHCQIEVTEHGETRRYNVEEGSDGGVATPFGTLIQRHCRVVRAIP